MPEEARIYVVTGVPHAPFRPLGKPVMQLPGNPLGYGAFMRALLIALTEWVEHGTRRRTAGSRHAPLARWCRSPRRVRDSRGCRW